MASKDRISFFQAILGKKINMCLRASTSRSLIRYWIIKETVLISISLFSGQKIAQQRNIKQQHDD